MAVTMGTDTPGWAAQLRAAIPEPHPMCAADIVLAHVVIIATILALVPPPTRTVRIVRAVLAPVIFLVWLYLGYVPLLRTPQERWGTSMLLFSFGVRTFEWLILFPPEHNAYRIRHLPDGSVIPEPVPEGWTWAKARWAASLWWSWRGIGWNFAPPLASNMAAEPFKRNSSRRAYVIHRSLYLVAVFLVEDLASTFMRIAAPDFFITATTPYSSLSTGQRAAYSIAVVVRIVTSIEFTHVGISIACVMAGGYFGISEDSELFSPWGWPPMFGSLGSIAAHPGLGYMWTRAWNQYNRRVLSQIGWVLIGERLLRMPPTGENVKNPKPRPVEPAAPSIKHKGVEHAKDNIIADIVPPTPPPDTPPADDNDNSNLDTLDKLGKVDGHLSSHLRRRQATQQPAMPLTPPDSGRSSPAQRTKRQSKVPSMVVNLAKSVIVFLLSGLHHDYASIVLLLDAIGRGDAPFSAINLTPFFVVQPLALAAEAIFKHMWRAFKRRVGLKETPALREAERVVALVWMWVFLGWSAGWFVEGMSRIGVWRQFPNSKDRHYSAVWWVWGSCA